MLGSCIIALNWTNFSIASYSWVVLPIPWVLCQDVANFWAMTAGPAEPRSALSVDAPGMTGKAEFLLFT